MSAPMTFWSFAGGWARKMGLNSAIERTQLDLDTNEGVMVGSEKRGVNDIPLLEAKETRVMRLNELPLDVSKELVETIRGRLEKLEKHIESLRVSLLGNPNALLLEVIIGSIGVLRQSCIRTPIFHFPACQSLLDELIKLFDSEVPLSPKMLGKKSETSAAAFTQSLVVTLQALHLIQRVIEYGGQEGAHETFQIVVSYLERKMDDDSTPKFVLNSTLLSPQQTVQQIGIQPALDVWGAVPIQLPPLPTRCALSATESKLASRMAEQLIEINKSSRSRPFSCLLSESGLDQTRLLPSFLHVLAQTSFLAGYFNFENPNAHKSQVDIIVNPIIRAMDTFMHQLTMVFPPLLPHVRRQMREGGTSGLLHYEPFSERFKFCVLAPLKEFADQNPSFRMEMGPMVLVLDNVHCVSDSGHLREMLDGLSSPDAMADFPPFLKIVLIGRSCQPILRHEEFRQVADIQELERAG